MHNIIIDQECGCFQKSDLINNVEIASKDDALNFAINTKDKMNEEFCGKHDFILSEVASNFVISFEQAPKSGCCGGGHCS